MVRCGHFLLLSALFCDFVIGQSTGSGVPFSYSEIDDVSNQEAAMAYFEPKYYNDDNKWSLSPESLQEAFALAHKASSTPALALGAAQVLYLYGWYRRSGEIIRDSVVAATTLFETSIQFAGCSKDLTLDEWLMRACDVRFGQAVILNHWLGETESAANQKQAYIGRSYALLDILKATPRFSAVSKAWTHPLQINFNQLKYKNEVSMPLWDVSSVSLAQFMEQNHHIFKAELEAIIGADNGTGYEILRKADGSIESLAPPGTWDAIRIVRYGHWNDFFCELCPLTCQLLRSRPEIAKCPYVNTNYYMLHPGGHLKPHFGNAPRMTVHLTVKAPEPLRAGFSVGPAKALWFEGKALVIDDTYPHAVSHWGQQPRYVLASWFCHPCDENNDPGDNKCPDWVRDR